MLQQRSDGGQWGLPGGSVEVGESVVEAIAREVREETGLIVKARRLIGVYSAPALQLVHGVQLPPSRKNPASHASHVPGAVHAAQSETPQSTQELPDWTVPGGQLVAHWRSIISTK